MAVAEDMATEVTQWLTPLILSVKLCIVCRTLLWHHHLYSHSMPLIWHHHLYSHSKHTDCEMSTDEAKSSMNKNLGSGELTFFGSTFEH